MEDGRNYDGVGVEIVMSKFPFASSTPGEVRQVEKAVEVRVIDSLERVS